MCGGKGGQTQTQSYVGNPVVTGAGTQAMDMARMAANRPFNLPSAPVAGFSNDQQQAFQQTRDAQGMALPYFNTAANYAIQSGSAITPEMVAAQYNPYAQNVFMNMQEDFTRQQRDIYGKLRQAAGGVGADRIAVGQSELARQQGLAMGKTASELYHNAQLMAQQERARQGQAGFALAQFGQGAQNSAFQGNNQLYGMGSQQQGLNQAQQMSGYNQALQREGYNFQVPQWLAGIAGGLSGAFGGTTTKTADPPPFLNQLLGAGMGAYGFGADQGWWGNNGGGGWGGDGYYGGSPETNPYLQPFASGGGVDVIPGGAGVVPNLPVQSAAPRPWIEDKKAGGSEGGLGDAMKTAGDIAKIAMMFARRGGRISTGGGIHHSNMYQGYDRGGSVDPADVISDPAPFDEPGMAEEAREAAARRLARPSFSGQYGWPLLHEEFAPPPPVPLQKDQSRMAAGNPRWPAPQTQDVIPTPDDDIVGQPEVAAQFPGGQEAWRRGVDEDMAEAPPMVAPASTPGAMASLAPSAAPAGPEPERDWLAPRSPYQPQQLPYDVDSRRSGARAFGRGLGFPLIMMGAGMANSYGSLFGAFAQGAGEYAKARKSQREEERHEHDVNLKADALMKDWKKHETMTPYQAEQLKLQRETQKASLMRPYKIGTDPNTLADIMAVADPNDPSGRRYRVIQSDGRLGPLVDPGDTTAPPKAAPAEATLAEPPPMGVKEFATNLIPAKSETPGAVRGPFATAEANTIKATDQRISKARDMLDVQRDQLTRLKMAYSTVMKDDKDGFFTRWLTLPGAADPAARVAAARKTNAVAMAAKKPPPFNPEKIAAIEEALKIQTTMGFSFASTISPREAIQGQLKAMEAQPGFTQSPQGMLRLIGLYDGLMNHGDAKAKFWSNWRKTNPRVAAGWEEDFHAKNPIERFTVRALVENTPYQKALQSLPQAIEVLRANKDKPAEIAKFDKLYNNTSSFFLNGRIDPFSGLK